MASNVACRSTTPPPKPRGSGCFLQRTPTAKKCFEGSRSVSPVVHKGLAAPSRFETPGGHRGNKQGLVSDDCSTAAPSPWTGSSSLSPWPSPLQGGTDFHLGSPCADIRRDSESSCPGEPIYSLGDIQLPDFYDFTEIAPPKSAIPDDEEIPKAFELPFDPEVAFPTTPAPVVRDGPPARPGQTSHPPLLKALIRRSEAEVRAALAAEPDAAQYPFWEHGAELALCAAVRLKCPPSIVQVLIQHGADASVVDANGKSPFILVRRAGIRDFGVEELLQEECGDASNAEDDANKGVQDIKDFPFWQFTWAGCPETPGLDLPCAEGLPEPPCWARM